MKVGIFSRTYEINDLRETYRRMTAHGIFHTQFNFSNAGLPTLPDHVEDKTIEEIRAVTSEYGITIHALSGTFNMIDPDLEQRQRGCDQFRVQCEAARALHIPVVSLCTGSKHPQSKWKGHEDNRKQESWEDLLRSTEQILRYAEENHIILGVEPEVSNIICTAELARKYLDTMQSPWLKIVMDGANLFRPEQTGKMKEMLDEAFALLGKDIVLAHAKDLLVEDGLSFVAAGSGKLDYPYYIRLLKQYGYNGPLILHGLSEEQIPESKVFIETTMQKKLLKR